MSGAQFGNFILGLIVVAIVVAIAVWLLHWLPAQLQGAGLRAHRPRWPEGGARRRRLCAADRARRDPGQHEHAAPRSEPRPRQGADHQGPHARRRDRRVLCARGHQRRCGGRGGADTGPADDGAGPVEGAGRGQVRRRAAHRCRRDDDGGTAREARRLRQARARSRGRGSDEERPRTRSRLADAAGPDRHGVLQPEQCLRRRGPDAPDRTDRAPQEAAQRRRAGHADRDP